MWMDGGDCVEFNEKYPDCETDDPSDIRNGSCDVENNIEECGWDGGDCAELNENIRTATQNIHIALEMEVVIQIIMSKSWMGWR